MLIKNEKGVPRRRRVTLLARATRLRRDCLGFTLIEILLVMAVIAIVSVSALSSYMNSTRSFDFISKYKEIVSMVRSARSYAVTSEMVQKSDNTTVLPDRYGIKIEQILGATTFTLFADTGSQSFSYDSDDALKDKKTYTSDYIIKLLKPSGEIFPIYLFFETGGGSMSIYKNSSPTPLPIPISQAPFMSFSFEKGSFKKFITVFQTSGMAEIFDVDPSKTL
ncbi:prepilin-type N-terminal cleavage/methylation domain-containing protein [Candidatus Peregrinibacteria bacterium]|nr:prepilin-type N-terminal cleavage/methylation domain-containing protein [Candidatus Peregrinibacteria bacterium]